MAMSAFTTTPMAMSVPVPVVITNGYVRFLKLTCHETVYDIVSQSRQTAIELDTLTCQGTLSTTADTPTDENVDIIAFEKPR